MLLWTAGCNRHDATTKSPLLESPRITLPSTKIATLGSASASPVLVASTSDSTNSSPKKVDAISRHQLPSTISSSAACLPLAILSLDPQSGGGGYLRTWAEKCPLCRFKNIGRGGAMVNQMLWKLRQYFDKDPSVYSHVVVFGGVNDLYSDQTANRTLDKIERDLLEIYRLARSHAQCIIAITVAPWGGFRRWYTDDRGRHTDELNNWIIQSRARGDTDLVVVSESALTCGDSNRLCQALAPPFHDGLHFGEAGIANWAKRS